MKIVNVKCSLVVNNEVIAVEYTLADNWQANDINTIIET